MPRTNRAIPTEAAIHIMCRGNNKLAILANDSDKKQYYYQLHKLKFDNNIDILHYCFMNNHIHLIVWLGQNSNLPRLMKQISLTYYHYYRKKHDYCGHLWQGRYKSIIIESDRRVLGCGKYIELNPVRARIVERPEQFQFSSYRYYALGQQDSLVTPNPAYESLGSDILINREIYANFVISPAEVLIKGDVSPG